ncbi:olfactory receptor 14I1-like [Hemicordylus capensis]|uniref:olfactory receptor 14I1-like n=1 Tax=Hemicordylus capensis TaxID=884348 RepID=UPI0023028885|nr:olfactory receptor 14I1-like [Hemicordylus capensis]
MQLHTEDNMNNFTSVSTFLLLEISEVRELQILHFFVFLALYFTTISGNLAIIVVVAHDHHLHTPMYFFLMNLAMMDLGTVSVIVPKSLANSLMDSWSISYLGCVAQVFFIFFFEASSVGILTIMAHDRYVAICNPLQYEIIMHKEACMQMAVSAWIASILYAMLHTGGTFAIPFCSNIVSQFFCEIPQLLKLSCSDLYLVEVGFLVFGCSLGLGCFIFIVVTYMQIFTAVLRIPSVRSQKKVLSTCLPHLTVVSLMMFSGIFTYVRPPTKTSSDMDIVFAVIYTVIPPLLNPFIYSMRNKEIKIALWKLFGFGHSSKLTSRNVLI